MGLVASSAPPAHAFVESDLVLDGTATVGNGLAYPCITGKGAVPPGVPAVDVAKCTSKLANVVPFTFNGTARGVTVKVDKSKCKSAPLNTCVQVSEYTLNSSGTVSGWCGLSIGQGSGTITKSANIVSTKPDANNPPITFNFTWTGIGGVLLITGTATRGTLTGGVVTGSPLALVLPGNVVGAGTCLNKAPKSFRVVGPVTVVWPNVP
jgi:hypothetical protein